jgi:hypothetical protein
LHGGGVTSRRKGVALRKSSSNIEEEGCRRGVGLVMSKRSNKTNNIKEERL